MKDSAALPPLTSYSMPSSARNANAPMSVTNGMLESRYSKSKMSLPLRGTGVTITNQLHEIHERKERLEMTNYQQKDFGQQ